MDAAASARTVVAGRAFGPVSNSQRADERRCCGWRSRVVLTPRRWRQVLRRRVPPNRAILAANPRSDGGKRARSPGRARRKPLKPLRRESRMSDAPAASCAKVESTRVVTTGSPVQSSFPCALCLSRDKSSAKPRTHGAARIRPHTSRLSEI